MELGPQDSGLKVNNSGTIMSLSDLFNVIKPISELKILLILNPVSGKKKLNPGGAPSFLLALLALSEALLSICQNNDQKRIARAKRGRSIVSTK